MKELCELVLLVVLVFRNSKKQKLKLYKMDIYALNIFDAKNVDGYIQTENLIPYLMLPTT